MIDDSTTSEVRWVRLPLKGVPLEQFVASLHAAASGLSHVWVSYPEGSGWELELVGRRPVVAVEDATWTPTKGDRVTHVVVNGKLIELPDAEAEAAE